MTRPAVFLDRDGVINRALVREGKPYPPSSADELEILAGVPEALQRLKAAGYALVVVTNQPDIARGSTSMAAVERINARLRALLPLDEIRMCPHDDADRCVCRKPKPGLLLQEPAHDMPASVMVGDRWRDIEAGQRGRVRCDNPHRLRLRGAHKSSADRSCAVAGRGGRLVDCPQRSGLTSAIL